jgi:DNA-binding response OmpR family regulator
VEVPLLAASELEAAVEAFRRANPQATAAPAGAALEMAEIVLERANRAVEHHPQLFEAAGTLFDQKRDLLTPRELRHLACISRQLATAATGSTAASPARPGV